MIFLKKIEGKPLAERREMIDKADKAVSVVKQCELLQISRSGLYHHPVAESTEKLSVMRFLDE